MQALYVVEVGQTNRLAAETADIQRWAAGVDDVLNRSAAQTGGVRNIRFVTTGDGTGGCVPAVTGVVLPAGSTTGTQDVSLPNMEKALQAAGYNRADRKYLVWADANVYCASPTPTPTTWPPRTTTTTATRPCSPASTRAARRQSGDSGCRLAR